MHSHLRLLAAAAALLFSSMADGSASTPSLPCRPVVVPSPFNAGRPMPTSPPRDPERICRVKPGCSPTRDDSPRILTAIERCNDGGTVLLDQTYLIGSPLDLTFLKHIDIVITGEVHLDDRDVYYWADNTYKFGFQNMSAFWKWGGEDVNIYGDPENGPSLIDGHGQLFWEEGFKNKTFRRPMLFAWDGMQGATMSHLRMRNSPMWFNIIANSTDILVSDMHLHAFTINENRVANSDGWDTYRSDRVVIQNSFINNTDDCVAFKPNSSNVVVQNLECIGSHGISVGSLGQYAGETDIVENLYIYNVSMANASDGARIKVWPGVQTSFQTQLNGGGGLGRVRNVTYDLFRNFGNDNAISISQCYGSKNQTVCTQHPANLTIEDITIKNMDGYVSGKNDPMAGSLICSAPDRCHNIRAENITVQVPSGKSPVYTCRNVDNALLGITCIAGDEDEERDTSQG